MAGVFDLELHDEDNIRDSDDDVIEVDDVSTCTLMLDYNVAIAPVPNPMSL